VEQLHSAARDGGRRSVAGGGCGEENVQLHPPTALVQRLGCDDLCRRLRPLPSVLCGRDGADGGLEEVAQQMEIRVLLEGRAEGDEGGGRGGRGQRAEGRDGLRGGLECGGRDGRWVWTPSPPPGPALGGRSPAAERRRRERRRPTRRRTTHSLLRHVGPTPSLLTRGHEASSGHTAKEGLRRVEGGGEDLRRECVEGWDGRLLRWSGFRAPFASFQKAHHSAHNSAYPHPRRETEGEGRGVSEWDDGCRVGGSIVRRHWHLRLRLWVEWGQLRRRRLVVG
jgi:hypothetical protein